MDICLISQDHELYKLCAEVLEEFAPNVKLIAGAGRHSLADIYIWDFHPKMVFPNDLDWSQKQKHFFLLHRRQVTAFHQKAPSTDVNLLLKPVTRATLKAFLANSLEMNPDRTPDGPQLT